MNTFDFDGFIKRITKNPPVAVMMCGVSGSGKTTFSKELEKHGFVRLSIDEEIYLSHGQVGVDFPAHLLEKYQNHAEEKLKSRIQPLLSENKNLVIDFSFWSKEKRTLYKDIIQKSGGKRHLVYLSVPYKILEKRLNIRNNQLHANAVHVSDKTLKKYYENFQIPSDEGGIVIKNI